MEKMLTHPIFIYVLGLCVTGGIILVTNNVHSKNMVKIVDHLREDIQRLFKSQDSLRVGQATNCINIENLRDKINDIAEKCYDRHK